MSFEDLPDLDRIKTKFKEPCSKCTDKAFAHIMDPKTQALMDPWTHDRHGYLQLHVHSPGVLDGDYPEGVLLFLTVLRMGPNHTMLYWTPSAPTIEGAIENLKECITYERIRLNDKRRKRVRAQEVGKDAPRQTGGGDRTSNEGDA